MDVTLTTFTQRRIVRDELNRRLQLYIENCTCNAPQPTFDDLKLDQHSPACEFVYLFEEKKDLKD